MTSQLQYEKILYLYSQALNNRDFESISIIFEQAADDPILKTMLFELDAIYQSDFPTEQDSKEQLPMSELHLYLLESTNGHNPIPSPMRRESTKLRQNSYYWLLRIAGILIVLVGVSLLYREFSNPPDKIYIELPPSFSGSPITTKNASQLTEIRRYGEGFTNGAFWSRNGENIIVYGTMGIRIYEADHLEEEPIIVISTDSSVNDADLSIDGTLLATAHNDGTVRIFNMESNQQIQSIQAYENYAWKVAISPDSRTVASSGSSRGAFLWSIETGRKVLNLGQGITWTKEIAFSPDGETLAWVSLRQIYPFEHTEERTGEIVYQDVIYLVDLATRDFRLLNNTKTDISAIQFSPDSKRLVALTGFNKHNLYIWDIEDEPQLSHSVAVEDSLNTDQTDSHFAFGNTIRFHSDTIFSLVQAEFVDTNTIGISNWDSETGTLDGVIELPEINNLFSEQRTTYIPNSISYSPDHNRILASYYIGTILVANSNTGEIESYAQGSSHFFQDFSISPNSSILAIGRGNTAYVWDIELNELIATHKIRETNALSLSFLPDSERLVIVNQQPFSSSAEMLGIWNFSTDEIEFIQNSQLSDSSIQQIDIHSTGSQFAFISQNHGAMSNIYDLGLYNFEASEVSDLAQNDSHIVSGQKQALFKPNDTLLAYTFGDSFIHIVTYAGDKITALTESNDIIQDMAFSPNGRYLSAINASGYWLTWDTETWEEISYTDVGAASTVDFFNTAIGFNTDSSLVALAIGEDITLWDVATQSLVSTIEGHSLPITQIEFSMDGSLLVSKSMDGTVRVWAIE